MEILLHITVQQCKDKNLLTKQHISLPHTPWQWLLQDPSYDPYGFAKVATRAASSEGGSAAACPANVQKFFSTILSLGSSATGRKQISTDMSLCSDSTLASDDDAQTLALYVQNQWTTAVGLHNMILDQCATCIMAFTEHAS